MDSRFKFSETSGELFVLSEISGFSCPFFIQVTHTLINEIIFIKRT